MRGALKTESGYSIYCKFDADRHKETYTNYLEVLISKSGEIMYAIPSHQEKAIELACKDLGVTRDELSAMCTREYYFDFLNWLLMMSGAAAVWNDSFLAPSPTKEQIGALRMLKLKGLYKGTIPAIKR